MEAELGRFPLANTIKGLMIKYWLRLYAGTHNSLLNEAFTECHSNQHEWMQGIHYLLKINGFGNVWNNPATVNKDNFHKYFRQRLNEIHIQNSNSKIACSNRFDTLHSIRGEYKLENYIKCIKDPEKREIFTRLRIDLNILSTCKSQGNLRLDLCPFCKVEPESVSHFLLKCNRYLDTRKQFFDKITQKDAQFDTFNDQIKLSYLLNVECPENVIGLCCKFISDIYSQRLKEK